MNLRKLIELGNQYHLEDDQAHFRYFCNGSVPTVTCFQICEIYLYVNCMILRPLFLSMVNNILIFKFLIYLLFYIKT